MLSALTLNECQIKGLARSNDTKILVENNKRFTDGVDDCVCKGPGVLDVGELFLKHGGDPRGGREPAELSVPDAPNRCRRSLIPIMFGRRHKSIPALNSDFHVSPLL